LPAPAAGACHSPDHLVGAQQQRLRDRETGYLGRPGIDDEPELEGLLDGQVVGARALQDPDDIGRGEPAELDEVGQGSGQRTRQAWVPGGKGRL